MKYFLLTLDVEDWFQVENFKSCIPFSAWPSCESRVERNTHIILDFLDAARSERSKGLGEDHRMAATFFVLGWVARRLPGLVREIHARGHELASHGYYHKLCSHCTPDELRNDLLDSKKTLEDILGTAVLGYRAPSFSVSEPVLGTLEECGYLYDSSFNSFSINKRHGQISVCQNGTGIACKVSQNLYELPISNLKIGRLTFPAGGGAYFRLIPGPLFLKIVRSVLRAQGAYLFYLHPWEVHPDQPKVKEAPAFLRFRHYTNISKTLDKLKFLVNGLKDFSFIGCNEYIRRMTTPGCFFPQ